MREQVKLNLEISDRYVSVIGAARSGLGAARVLQDLGAHVLLSDSRTIEQFDTEQRRAIESTGARFAAGATPEQAIPYGTDLVVTSPGVRRSADVLLRATDKNIPIWSEIELAYRLSPARMIATTGTNGKTTTTLLIAAILRSAGFDAVAAGNISADEIKRTLIDAAYDAFKGRLNDRVLVAEISSFQLEWVDLFAPWIGLLLNVTPDHMNRHDTFEEYYAAKARMFEKQTESDWSLLNFDDEAIRKTGVRNTRSRRVWISAIQHPPSDSPRAYVAEGAMFVELNPGVPVEIMRVADMPETLPGLHSVFNALAASTAATIAGVEPHSIENAVRAFCGVPHRMEVVADVRDVRYINNSMCTNVAAAISSIHAIGRTAIVIMGGADKETDFSPLARSLSEDVRSVILIGSAAQKMETAFRSEGYYSISRADTLDEAVNMAAASAKRGEAVVLSPGCASFDMFRDFEARGAAFRAAVGKLDRD